MLFIRSVVNAYENGEEDAHVEQSFTASVNDSLKELQDAGAEVTSVSFSTVVLANGLVKTADIQYEADEEVDTEAEEEEDEDEIPELGVGRRKVTKEVFQFVKDKLAEGYSPEDIKEMFDDEISVWTVYKIRDTRSFRGYYNR